MPLKGKALLVVGLSACLFPSSAATRTHPAVFHQSCLTLVASEALRPYLSNPIISHALEPLSQISEVGNNKTSQPEGRRGPCSSVFMYRNRIRAPRVTPRDHTCLALSACVTGWANRTRSSGVLCLWGARGGGTR